MRRKRPVWPTIGILNRMSDSKDFSTLKLRPELLGNLPDLGYVAMTLVQNRALPPMLRGDDVLVRAKTGSGKTAAFGLGILNGLDAANFSVQALILCPTRELADQVAREIRRLARAIPNVKVLGVCGGMPLRDQVASLKRSPHIVVGTPGRVLKHLRDGNIELAGLKNLVLDEADRMLDMGFSDELNSILEHVPRKRQTALFSATYPESIGEMSSKVQRQPVVVDVTDTESPAQIIQSWCSVTRENRNAELLRALRAFGGDLNLVFCNTKLDCANVARYLIAEKVRTVALHGDLDQAERNQVLVRFSNRSASILIATDVAARGLDIKNVDAVFNYELPPKAEVYVHRIGRTGRAGQGGVAISLVEEREAMRLTEIQKAMSDTVIQQRRIPDAPRGADNLVPQMTTIQINGGRKNKLRPGDLLGALTASGGVRGDAVGSIDLFDSCSYVAVCNAQAKKAVQQLGSRPIKGRKFRARIHH